MSRFSLSERQKKLIQSIAPGLMDGSVDTEWAIITGDDRIVDIFGLDSEGKLWEEIWKDNVKEADFAVFERCGFFQ
jgi:hypothetical protein